MTQNELTKYARSVGLRWTTPSVVRDFESGRSAPTFATVFAVCLALQNATGRAVSLADLVATPDEFHVVLNDQFAPKGTKVMAVASGKPWPKLDQNDWDTSLLVDVLTQLSKGSGLDEQRLAKRLDITEDRLAQASFRLWGRAFSDERDRRAGPDANAQKRGRVSRILQAELEKVLADGNDI